MMIRILLPPRLAEIADALKKFFGAHLPVSVCKVSSLSLSFLGIASHLHFIQTRIAADEIREFEVSMNRAAERASSTAIDIFVQAIMAMNFQYVLSEIVGDVSL